MILSKMRIIFSFAVQGLQMVEGLYSCFFRSYGSSAQMASFFRREESFWSDSDTFIFQTVSKSLCEAEVWHCLQLCILISSTGSLSHSSQS